MESDGDKMSATVLAILLPNSGQKFQHSEDGQRNREVTWSLNGIVGPLNEPALGPPSLDFSRITSPCGLNYFYGGYSVIFIIEHYN